MTQTKKQPLISIVLPAYNEVSKIAADIERASGFLHREGLTGEIIVVDDGSTDGTAEAAQKASVADGVDLAVEQYESNRGKGYAVRYGVLKSRGELVLFSDCGCCVPYSSAKDGIELLNGDGYVIAHASRRARDSKIHRDQGFKRRLFSMAFRWVVVNFVGVPGELTDTQCGFKLYRGDVARELFAECVVEGFMFDIEVILRAKRAGHKIAEFPVEWTCDLDSRLTVRRNSVEILRELMQIRRELGQD